MKSSINTNSLLKLSDKELKKILCPFPIVPEARDFEGKELRECIQGDRLLNMSIDLSSTCNLNCPFCYTAKANSATRTNAKDMLSIDDYKNLVLRFKEAGVKTINIVGDGEPTLYPYLETLLRFISDLGFKICLVSNGIVLSFNDKLLNLLDELKVTICLKLNSFNNSVQDPLVGMKGYTTLRDKALKKILERNFTKEFPTRLAVNTLLLKPIYEEFKEIFKFCRENNIALISSLYIPNGRTENNTFNGKEAIVTDGKENLFQPLNKEEITNLLKFINTYDEEHNIVRSPNPAYISGIPCTQLLGFQIDNKGKIWSCPSRKLIENGKIIDKEICTINSGKDLLALWKESNVRELYTGRCLYKTDINNFSM